MYDLETLENNGEISSELKNLIEIDSDIFKDYNAFAPEYFKLRNNLKNKNPEGELRRRRRRRNRRRRRRKRS